MVAPASGELMVTVCAELYVPAEGLNVRAAPVAPETAVEAGLQATIIETTQLATIRRSILGTP